MPEQQPLTDPREMRKAIRAHEFPSGLTVAGLKAALALWPNVDGDGQPLEVWIGSRDGASNQAFELWPMNKRTGEDGSTWADIILEPRS